MHWFDKHPVLELATRIAAGVAILLAIVLVVTGILVDRCSKAQLCWERGYVLSILTVTFWAAGVISVALYSSGWVEGLVR